MPHSLVLKALLSLAIVVALAAPAPFDAARLRTGRFSYDVRDAQAVVASGVLQVARDAAGGYAFDGTFTASVCQHWESTAAGTFAPRSAMLQFCKDGTNRRVFDLAYAGNRVTGVRHVGTPPQVERRPVEAKLPDDTVDQRIDWAAVMALDLRPGMAFRFNVYDPGTGLSPLIGRVQGVEAVDVPAGRFRAYRVVYQMNKPAGDEHYQSLVTVDTPRMLLAITFPNGTTSRLLELR